MGKDTLHTLPTLTDPALNVGGRIIVDTPATEQEGVLASGTIVGQRYEILRYLASGGMSVVYEVLDSATGRRRALKLMPSLLVRDADKKKRFEIEARIGATLDTELVVDVLDVGIDEVLEVPFLIMELLHGETLGNHLKRNGPLSPAKALTILHQIAMVLSIAQEKGIVHCDLKPENIFLLQRHDGVPRIKVLDFGIAWLTLEPSLDSPAAGLSAPLQRRPMGTPAYMAPEQKVSGQKLTAATDIFAFGMLAYTMLVGMPYRLEESDSPTRTNSARAKAQSLDIPLPPAFDEWFACATSARPDERFAGATEAMEALTPILECSAEGAPKTVNHMTPSTLLAKPRNFNRWPVTSIPALLLWIVLSLGIWGGLHRWGGFLFSNRVVVPTASSASTDLFYAPVGHPFVPINAAELFGPPETGVYNGGPCLVEPESGALVPRNWPPPKFRWIPGEGQNLFELRLLIEGKQMLRMFSTAAEWTIPANTWQELKKQANGGIITIMLRGASFDGAHLASPITAAPPAELYMAPVDADGSITFLTGKTRSTLMRLPIENNPAEPLLQPEDVRARIIAGGGQDSGEVACIGCHAVSPDGATVGFTAQAPWNNRLAQIVPGSSAGGRIGDEPQFLSQNAVMALRTPDLGMSAFSPAHWSEEERLMITPAGTGRNSKLVLLNLLSTDTPVQQELRRAGDARGAGAPSWSRDGKTVVYVSTNSEYTGRLSNGKADLYSIPFNGGVGGQAQPVKGASEAEIAEYYPAFSPDDRYLIFTHAPNGEMYSQPLAELSIVPVGGGTPTRLRANAPASCSGQKSPGVTNSWARWAPSIVHLNGKAYYWIVFSSKRLGNDRSQIFLTAVVDDGNELLSFGALHFPNQSPEHPNHMPDWTLDAKGIAP